MHYKPGICTFCGTGCGNFLKVNNDKIEGVFSSLNHPISKGRLCVRGWNIHELFSTGERITEPMKRNGDRLEKTTYEDAVSILSEKLSALKNDPAKIGFLASARSSNEENYLLMKLARAVFKTNNISLPSATAGKNSLEILNDASGMAGMSGSLEDISKAEYILVVDFDVTRQNPIIGSEIHFAAQAGADLITIDSIKTQIAKLSRSFIQPEPGTIKLVLAAMGKIIIDKGLIDAEFIKKYTEGFEDFKNAVKGLSADSLISAAGVSKEAVESAAAGLAKAKTAMAFFPFGISGLDAETMSYIYNIFLMTGKIGKEGCGVNPIANISNMQGSYDMGITPDHLTGSQPVADKSVIDKFNKQWGASLNTAPGAAVHDLLENKNSDLKALVVIDHDDGIIQHPERIGNLDFVAYIGAFKNPFMKYADVVLPISAFTETDGTFTNAERRVQLNDKKTEPLNKTLAGWQLYAKIAEKAGVKWSYGSPSDIMNEIAKVTPSYSGITYEKLKKSHGIQWPCNNENPNGTKRLKIDKNKLKFIPVKGAPKTAARTGEFPHLLKIGKSRHYWHKNNIMTKTFAPKREYDALLLQYPDGYIEVSKEDAKKIGIRDGWAIKVNSPYGSTRAVVMTSDNVRPNTAYVELFNIDNLKALVAKQADLLKRDEDTIIPIRIEKI